MSAVEMGSAVLLSAGAFFMLLAALGIVRMPDLYTRMSATSKASTLGASLLALGAAAAFGREPVLAEAVALVAFLFLTAPVAAHMIGRAGYLTGVRPSPRTRVDALAGSRDSAPHRQKDGGVGDVP
jgi:multicomponent Na+:H+ antiporter subunit G